MPPAKSEATRTIRGQHEFYTLFPTAPILPRVPFETYRRWKDAGDVQAEDLQGSNLYFVVNVWRNDQTLGQVVNVKRCVTMKPRETR